MPSGRPGDGAMKFRVERDVLAEAVAWASRALPARPVIPVLSGLLLRAAEDGLTLSCFDYEVSARVEVDAEIDEPGTVLVPGRLLAEITRSLPDLPAEFADDPEGVSLTCGSASFTLVTLPVEDYPSLPGLPQTAGTVDGGALAAAIGQVAPASSRDDTLPLLTGVNVEVDGEVMTLAATDRYRLAVRDLPWSPAQPGMTGAYLVPARTLVDAARSMATGVPVTIKLQAGTGPARGQDGPAEAGLVAVGEAQVPGGSRASTDAMIGFETGGRRLTTRLIAGEFIKYRSRFPADFRCRADMPAGPFTEAVKRVSLVAERGTAVRLVFGAGAVTIEAGTQGRARAREIIPAQFQGTEPAIAFSPHFLLDGILAAAVSATAPAGGSAPDGGSAPASEGDAADQPAGAEEGSGGGPEGGTAEGPKQAGAARTAKRGTKRKPPAKRASGPGAKPDGQPGAVAEPGQAGRADRADGTDQAGAQIRLEFSSATKPAVITGIRAAATAVADAAGDPGSDPDGAAAQAASADSAPAGFRYLVVPLRVAGAQ
jgi:DNA polymerase III subunit beta